MSTWLLNDPFALNIDNFGSFHHILILENDFAMFKSS